MNLVRDTGGLWEENSGFGGGDTGVFMKGE